MRTHVVFGLLFVVLPHLVLDYGCSLIGFGVGYAVDSSTRDTSWVTGSSDWQMKQSDSTRILLKNGTSLEGTFQGASVLPDTMYERKYLLALAGGGFDLPMLHDSVVVRRIPGVSSERVLAGEFLGFGVDDASTECVLNVRCGEETRPLTLRTVEILTDQQGREWTRSALLGRVEEGRVLLNRGVVLRTASSDTALAVCDIDSILVPQESSWRWVGLGIGAVADVTALVLLTTLGD